MKGLGDAWSHVGEAGERTDTTWSNVLQWWFGWRPKTWTAPEPPGIMELPLCSLTYMAVCSLKFIFLLVFPLYLLWGKTCTQGRLETQPPWVEGAGAAAGMDTQGRGLQQALTEGSGQRVLHRTFLKQKSPISFGCQTALLSFQITSTSPRSTKIFYNNNPPKEKQEMENPQAAENCFNVTELQQIPINFAANLSHEIKSSISIFPIS